MTQLIKVQDDNQVVTFSPIGGGLASWTVDGREIFYHERPTQVGDELKPRGGMPVLFPFFGDLPPRFASLNLPKHGLLRTLAPTRTFATGVKIRSEKFFGEKSDVECEVSTRVRLLKGKRGFAFILRVTTLIETVPMPFINPGFHPYFRTPVGTARVLDKENEYRITTSTFGPETKPVGKNVDVILDGLGRVRMNLRGMKNNRRGNYVTLWRDEAGYLCVEPTLLPPSEYGASSCPMLRDEFEMSCTFEFFDPE